MKPSIGIQRAMESLADKLDLPFDFSSSTWPSEVANSADLDSYFELYDTLNNEDEKFVLLQIIIQAISDLTKSIDLTETSGPQSNLDKLEKRLTWDFGIQKSTIKKWSRHSKKNKETSRSIASITKGLLRKNSLKKNRILFICTANQMRSASAHHIYKNDVRFEVKSAGTHPAAETIISNELLKWADHVLVMEGRHRSFIQKNYPELSKEKKIIILDIPDDYDFMQAELIAILRNKVEPIFMSF